MKHTKNFIVYLMMAAMVFELAIPEPGISAAAKPKLSTKSVKVRVGAKKKVTVKKGAGYTITVKTKKKTIASVKKKGKSAFVVTGVKKGKTKVVCTAKKGKKKVTLNCAVTVTDSVKASNAQSAANNPATANPATNNPSNLTGNGSQGNVNPTLKPTPVPTDAPFPQYDKDTYMPLRYADNKENVPKGQTESMSYGSGGKATVWLPAGYVENEKYPVLYLLAGENGTDDAWKNMNADQIIANAITFKYAKKMIVVIPDISQTGDEDFLNEFASDLMPAVESKYSVATGRVNTAVAGYDTGGRMALRIGTLKVDKVAYAGAFAPVSGYDLSGYVMPEEYKDKDFIMIQRGKSDTVSGSETKDYSDTLTSNGIEHFYFEVEGEHDENLYQNGLYNFVRRIFKRGTDDEGFSNGFVTEYGNTFPNTKTHGTIEKFEYNTETYDPEGSVKIHKYANVYLPAGYDPDKQYNILYLMHGGGENAETWIVGDKETNPRGYGDYTNNQRMLNYLFETGEVEPCIIVNPTFYRPSDAPAISNAWDLTKLFRYELRNDLIPGIEAKYHTYADYDVSEEKLQATRMHRAFAGLSMGSNTTYQSAIYGNFDYFAWFGTFSGYMTVDTGSNETEAEKFVDHIAECEAKGWPLAFLYCGNGEKDSYLDVQYDLMEKALIKSDILVPGKNYTFNLIPDAEHNMWQWHVHLYNILHIFFTK